ncbi:hypothetical protein ACLBWX_16690 [Methylobacterium sp. M6A4_1b]
MAAGAIMGSALAHSQAQAALRGIPDLAACARRFRSCDATSGTCLIGTDGAWHPCP